VRWIWSVTWLLELPDVSGSIGTGSSVNRSRSRTTDVTLLVEIGRIGRFRSFADLDFSLHYDGVLSTSISKVRDFSGEGQSTVARRIGRGLSGMKAERLGAPPTRRQELEVGTTSRRSIFAGVDEAKL
jgi:hypothetical protein